MKAVSKTLTACDQVALYLFYHKLKVPLRPYLFIQVLTVLLRDTDRTLETQGIPTNTWSEGCPVHDLEYADDTFIMIGIHHPAVTGNA